MTDLAYILAASHSGSTLLTMLLNSHPDIATVGELAPGHMEAPDRYLCSCGRRIKECEFWRTIGVAARDRGLPFRVDDFGTRFCMPESRLATRLLRPLHRGPAMEFIRDAGLRLLTPWPRRFKEIVRANETLIELVMEHYGASVFVDKGNKALRLRFLRRIPSLAIRVIHLIRDGRAVALTYMDPAKYADAKDESLRGGGGGGDRANERLSMAEAAYQWRRCNEEAEHAMARIDPCRKMEVRYEDLCADPGAVLRRVSTFVGLDSARYTSDFRTAEHHVVGNGMRLDSAPEIRLDDRWRSVLTAKELNVFDRVAGDLNRRYGYE